MENLLASFGKNKNLIISIFIVVIVFIIIKYGSSILSTITNIFNGHLTSPSGLSSGTSNSLQSYYADFSGTSSPFNVSMYANNPGASTLDFSTLQNMSSTIHNSYPASFLGQRLGSGSIGDAISAFKTANNKVDISNLAQVYKDQYSSDLLTDLWTNFGDMANGDSLNTIFQYVSNLPTT